MLRVPFLLRGGLALPLLMVAAALPLCVGCNSEQTPEQLQQRLQAVADFARDNDMAASISVTITGDAAVYAQQRFGLDTGLRIVAHLQANAADDETPTPTAATGAGEQSTPALATAPAGS